MANEFPQLSDVFALDKQVTYTEAVEQVWLPQDNAILSVPSASPIETLTLSAYTITPTVALGAITYASGTTAELHFIDYSNLRDGAIIQIRILDNTYPITIKNGITGNGGIFTSNGEDILLSDYRKIVQLQREGSIWRQVGTIQSANLPITNCITEIPQDIKLELNNGTLTLKAGSKVYVPNGKNADGSNKFDEVMIAYDVTHTLTVAGQWIVSYTNGDTAWGSGPRIDQYNTNVFSGSAAPTVSAKSNLWYDTTNNVMKTTYDNGASWVVSKSALPICLITATTSGIQSIDQVFNGFGYIGSTVYALPGVKGLIPNGRNADGSLKNIEFVSNGVKIINNPDTNNKLQYILFESNGTFQKGNWYYEQTQTPSWVSNNDNIWYNPETNKMYYYRSSTNQSYRNFIFTGLTFRGSNGSTTISEFNQAKLPFRAADDQGVVKTSGDQTIGGVKTFTSDPYAIASQPNYYLQMLDYDNSTTPTAAKVGALTILDKNKNIAGRMGFWTWSDGSKSMRFITFDGQGNNTQLQVGFKSNGSGYTTCPTPESTSNTNAIATTAWVRNYVKNTGGGANWASKVSVARDTNYTAPSNGYIAALMQFDDASGTLTINNAQIFTAGGNVQSPSFTFVPVSKGDVVKLSGGAWVTAYFVPFK